MRILIVNTQYQPVVNPNVFRWSAIAAYWVQQGHEVHVLCTERTGTPNELEINGVRVHRLGNASLLDAVYNLFGTQKRRGEVGNKAATSKHSLRLFLEKIADITWRSFYWPDGSCVWYFPGRKRALQLQQQYRFDAIISVTLPFTSNLIAAAIKKHFPKIQWLMDIEDPFAFSEDVFINNLRLYRRFNYRKEAQLLALADAVSVTLENARQRYQQYFPKVKDKIAVTPPMYSMPKTAGHLETDAGKIHLGYFGAFYYPIRTPDIVLELFTQLANERLVLHFFGEIAPVFQPVFAKYQKLLPNLRIHGLISRERVAAATQTMDFLINIGNATDYHLPSKSVDYLMSGKPILNFSFCKNDPFVAFLANYPLILNLDFINGLNDNHVLQAQFFITEKYGQRVPATDLKMLGGHYSVENIANQYLSLLKTSAE